MGTLGPAQGDKQGGRGKIAVLGILESGSELCTGAIPKLATLTVQTVIRENAKPGTALMTDEHDAFFGLSNDYNHPRVNRHTGEHVRHYCLHTNGIEEREVAVPRYGHQLGAG